MIKRNIFSLIIAIIICYLSLANARTFENSVFSGIPQFDKFVHFSMYFALMSVIILEHRRSIRNIRQIFLIAIIPFAYGVLLEFAQAYLTTTRSGSVYDALADLAGVFFSIFLWFLLKNKLRLDLR